MRLGKCYRHTEITGGSAEQEQEDILYRDFPISDYRSFLEGNARHDVNRQFQSYQSVKLELKPNQHQLKRLFINFVEIARFDSLLVSLPLR